MNKTINFDMADAVARYAEHDCGKMCGNTALPENPVPTMAYIPFQLDKSSYTAEMALREAGIQLFGGVSGDADSAVEAFLAGKLEFNPNVQCNHHGNHDEHHNCANHSCHK